MASRRGDFLRHPCLLHAWQAGFIIGPFVKEMPSFNPSLHQLKTIDPMKPAIALAFAAALAIPLTSHAQFQNAEAAVKYRQGAFTVMGSHFGSIGAVVKGEKPYDKLSVEQDAAVIATLAKLPWHAFTPNSATPASKAKPEVWSEADKFKAGAEKLQAETAKLDSAARSGDLAAIKASFGATAQTCKSCHDNFRNK